MCELEISNVCWSSSELGSRTTEKTVIFLSLNQLHALISQIYFWNKTLHVSDSSSAHHQEFFTVYTTMVYVVLVC